MRKIALAVMALLLAALVGGGIAWASVPAPDGSINGCYKTSGPAQGAVIVIDSTASCPSGYAPLNWPSLSGTVNRAEQLRLVEEVTSENIRDGVRETQADATCPLGYKVAGGGFETENNGSAWQDDHLFESTRLRWYSGNTGYDSWLVDMEPGPDGQVGDFKAIAMCVNAAYWWQDGAPFQTPPANPPYPGNS
jgi:hypothetical protein